MMWGWDGWSWWGWLLMMVSMVLFWGLIIGGIVLIVRSTGRGRPPTERRDPEQVLAERFAAGEIDEEEYQRRLQVLRSARHDARQRQP